MRFVKLFLVLLAVFTLSEPLNAEGISVSQSLSESAIPFESSAAFEIKLQWNGPQWTYRFDKPLSPTFDRLKVKGFTSSISSQGSGADEISIKTYQYTLIPTSSGKGTIDPINITYVTLPDSIPGELVTEGMTIQISEPVLVKETNWTKIILIITVIAIVLVSIIVVFFLKLRKRGDMEIKKSPKEKGLEDLAALKIEAGNDMKKYQTGLYQLLKDFVTAQYAINIETLEDEMIINRIMETGLSKADSNKLSGWIIKARQDKFRPVVSAPGDTIRLETEIREFFNKI